MRFEDPNGVGLFLVAHDFLWYFAEGCIRVSQALRRESESLYRALCELTPAAPVTAYADTRSRQPITWFQGDSPALRAAERLVQVLNRYGADLRRLETDNPPTILWADADQAVSRRPRRPPISYCDAVTRRRRERRKRQWRRRQRAAWRKARWTQRGGL